MGGAIVEAVEHGTSFEGHVADRIIFAHELLDGVEALKPHQSLELDLPIEVALHQIDMEEARYLPRLNARNDFRAHDALVCVGILRRGPAAPETADHQTRIGMRT